ncbi:type II toxin-antitoxin system RelE/ParE family toxin [Flavobacterium sp. RHBU_3]|uniref:type II toxin-antitoxin system RelE/ParE family toxin n=1 Tax=Flavobacterium sp. RHBU_3 TaxID=3391184 RepID=UPI003984C235
MAFKVIVTTPAKHDIFKALDWYESRQPGLGNRFYQSYSDVISYIKTNPELFNIKYNNYREAKLQDFPYVVIFEISYDVAYVYAIFNTHKNPGKKPNK